MELQMKLIEEFKDLVPDSLFFDVGYFEGQKHSKIWLVDKEDFSTMYRKYPREEISLWCDGHTEAEDCAKGGRKRKRGPSKRREREKEVDEVSQQLKEKHGDKYDTPRLRLWARTVFR